MGTTYTIARVPALESQSPSRSNEMEGKESDQYSVSGRLVFFKTIDKEEYERRSNFRRVPVSS